MFSARFTFCSLVLLFFVTGCTKKPQQRVALRTRITAASPSQSCHSANGCFNPHILVLEKGYFVTIFSRDRPQSTAVSTEGLGEFLIALPMSAWPLGPVVGITPSDDVIDSQAYSEECRRSPANLPFLGLDVRFRPGG